MIAFLVTPSNGTAPFSYSPVLILSFKLVSNPNFLAIEPNILESSALDNFIKADPKNPVKVSLNSFIDCFNV